MRIERKNEHFIVKGPEGLLEAQLGQPITPFTTGLPELRDAVSITRTLKMPGVGEVEVVYLRDPDFSLMFGLKRPIFLPGGEVSVVQQYLSNGEERFFYPFMLKFILGQPRMERKDCLIEFPSFGKNAQYIGRDWQQDKPWGLYHFLPVVDLKEENQEAWGEIYLPPDNPEALADLRITFLENPQQTSEG